MDLGKLLNPWAENFRLRRELERARGEAAEFRDKHGRAKDMLMIQTTRAAYLEAELAKFDHDGDGKPGGSKKRVKK